MNFKTLISASLTALVLFTTPLLSQQQEEGTGIEERLSLYLPIFQSPHCSNYLTDFGDPEKQVSNYAKTIGLDDPSLLKPKDAAGTYFHMYQEPDPLVNNDGIAVTDQIIYTFVFTPDKKYLSFSFTADFKSSGLANSFQKSLLEKIGVFEFTREHSQMVECNRDKNKGNQRIVTLKVNGTTVTMVIVDYNTLQTMLIKQGRSKS